MKPSVSFKISLPPGHRKDPIVHPWLFLELFELDCVVCRAVWGGGTRQGRGVAVPFSISLVLSIPTEAIRQLSLCLGRP